MKVAINNLHEEGSGGGGYWSSQITKAVSSFCEVDLTCSVSEERMQNNPELHSAVGAFQEDKEYDYFIDVNHFSTITCGKAKKNIKVCFFPKIESSVSKYDEIVTLSAYSAHYIKAFYNREALICQPYSKDLVPSEKKAKTIVAVGNIFFQDDTHCKNQHILIDAFKELGEGWQLDIIGNPVNHDYMHHLSQMAAGLNIFFHPSTDDANKERILGEAKFFWHANGFGRIQPHQTEHFGIAPEEALKSGCLTYVHRSGGAQDFCSSWTTPQELIKMTLAEFPNPEKTNFSNHEKTVEFWKGVLV